MFSIQYNVLPISYNSQCTTLSEWVVLYTLGLAPLIAHVASGANPPTCLTHTRPAWHDAICHFNPTSIIWRYAAIADRRIRAKSWDANDLAASNAFFWTAKGWDGGEEIVQDAATHLSRSPGTKHVRIISESMLKTIITLVQGVSALYTLIGTLLTATQVPGGFYVSVSLDILFYPLAIFGLLRLCAAAWLTEDFVYTSWNQDGGVVARQIAPERLVNDRDFQYKPHDTFETFLVTSLPDFTIRFHPPISSWPSRIFRSCYLLILGGVLAISLSYVTPITHKHLYNFTITGFLTTLFYALFLLSSLLILGFYFIRGQTTSTLIPCISATWYKIYTLLVLGFIFVLVVIASIETWKHPTGNYITSPPTIDLSCKDRNYFWQFPLGSTVLATSNSKMRGALGAQNASSLVEAAVSGKNVSFEKDLTLTRLTGYCSGRFEDVVLR
ncbi:hypothetical protein BCR34DRAFT_596338 [Clohesyomyces aquaticus]|uniref:Uncharacterized protein n=1 Tax=Clohesyomyces aquaticus TaxID=1231657 RepID=A0A1Y2A7G8_9PLEO|nr:hypothetical protein BCR34DRAFT_596338 [Clohesyomyces aquaticus]